jgi:ribulose 1,5-bisphosphate carboxylase large subunit-like protein
MKKTKLYTQIKEIQKLVWKDDDLILQETLFELQDRIAVLALIIAKNENKTGDLINSFSWLYKNK